MTIPDEATTASPTRAEYVRHRQPFGGHVAATVAALQQRYRRRSPSAVAALAQLRAATGAMPGARYGVLEWTGVPDQYLGYVPNDEPTDTEHAKHTAMTLFATHQQSLHDTSMHRDGRGLGTAVNLLSRAAGVSAEAVHRRFAALGTATTFDQTAYHLRSLIRQLRDKRIALDYGLLADDLVALQRPGGHERVRSRWGRDFYRTPATDSRTTDPSTSDTTNHNESTGE